jgi:hypothetical protein
MKWTVKGIKTIPNSWGLSDKESETLIVCMVFWKENGMEKNYENW